MTVLTAFVSAHPDDADVTTFKNAASHIEKELNAKKY
jgi:hypothetical protein